MARSIIVVRTIDAWSREMGRVFRELYRITRKGGYAAFEVGEARKKNVLLEERVVFRPDLSPDSLVSGS